MVEGLSRKLADAPRELQAPLEQQTATSEVTSGLSSSSGELNHALDFVAFKRHA
jgi:hypothetical protein